MNVSKSVAAFSAPRCTGTGGTSPAPPHRDTAVGTCVCGVLALGTLDECLTHIFVIPEHCGLGERCWGGGEAQVLDEGDRCELECEVGLATKKEGGFWGCVRVRATLIANDSSLAVRVQWLGTHEQRGHLPKDVIFTCLKFSNGASPVCEAQKKPTTELWFFSSFIHREWWLLWVITGNRQSMVPGGLVGRQYI